MPFYPRSAMAQVLLWAPRRSLDWWPSCRYPHSRSIEAHRKPIHVDHDAYVSLSALGSDFNGSPIRPYSSLQSAKQCHDTELESHSYIHILWSLLCSWVVAASRLRHFRLRGYCWCSQSLHRRPVQRNIHRRSFAIRQWSPQCSSSAVRIVLVLARPNPLICVVCVRSSPCNFIKHNHLLNGGEPQIQDGKYGLIIAVDTADVSNRGHITTYPGDSDTVMLQIPFRQAGFPSIQCSSPDHVDGMRWLGYSLQ
jgi:hypothetical protein